MKWDRYLHLCYVSHSRLSLHQPISRCAMLTTFRHLLAECLQILRPSMISTHLCTCKREETNNLQHSCFFSIALQ